MSGLIMAVFGKQMIMDGRGNPFLRTNLTGSVGDIAVALSDPNVIYVASGEGIQRPDLGVGNGVYKSTDTVKTWIIF